MTPLDAQVGHAIHRHFADSGRRPAVADIAASLGRSPDEVAGAFRALAGERILVLEEDGASIRMAPPFSGVPTQHAVESNGVMYFANCAWDALGIPAALRRPATVRSRCEQTHQPLTLAVEPDGPERSDWLFHCHLPAARWWDDIVFT